MTNIQHVFKALSAKFPDSEIKINGYTDLPEHYSPSGRSGNHLKLDITSELFENKTLLEQHKMVHNTLEKFMQVNDGFIHALTIKTKME
ncbi:MAG: BolA family protein [Candidatus Neomarinimicrobiota bacterium]